MSRSRKRMLREEMLKEEAKKTPLPPRPLPPLPPPPPPLPPPPKPKKVIKDFKFAVSFVPNNSKGGSHQFVLTLLNYLNGKCQCVDLTKKYDLLFVVADLYKFLPNNKAKIVHRLDGCFYDHGYEPGGNRDINQREMCKIADLIIHQSQYGKMTMEDRGIVDRDRPNIVIYNGVNRALYKPVAHTSPPRIITMISANNSKLKIKRVDRLNQFVGFDTKIIHIGQTHPSVDLNKSILTYKAMAPDKLNNFFSSSQVFIHTGDTDTCPNVILQALSTGLPVIYWKSSGSGEELVGNTGLAVEDYPSPKELLEVLRNNYQTYHKNALERAKMFDIKVIGQQYYDAFCEVLQNE